MRIKNGLVVGVILLFIGVAVQPSIGLSNNNDTTPPVTTHTLNPPEPDGETFALSFLSGIAQHLH